MVTSTFPGIWKIARISPIPKIVNPSQLKDERPISIPPILSKIYERLVLQQMTEFIEKQLIYHKHQSRYRKNHSTTTLLMKLYEDIKTSMNKSEITIAIFADYFKAFHTIDFYSLIQKMHTFNFSKNFLYWTMNYLIFRQYFVQIEAHFSTLLTSEFGVSQGYILGPILFNLCVADMSQMTPESECLQYEDDTTLYRACKASERHACISHIEKDIHAISRWSSDTNLIFNSAKTKAMVISTPQMSKHHQLKEEKLNVKCNNITLERVYEHFHLDKHISNLLKDCYLPLSMLKKLKRYTTLPIRKQLTESLIFSRLDCCNNLFIDLPQYQIKRLLKLQKACAGFVLKKYATCEDVTKLKWLLVPERTNFTIVKLIFRGLLRQNITENLEIQVRTSNWSLRTPNKVILEYANLQKQQSFYINYANTVFFYFLLFFITLDNI